MARIVFFGNERLATGVTTQVPTLQALITAGHEVVAIVANHHAASSRRDRALEIEAVARQHAIPLSLPRHPSDIADDLASFGADLGVLVAYGRIVPQSIIDIFPSGIINVHPSLLPAHRGPIPIEAVILDGSDKTGVSVMQLSGEMDAGDVWAQTELPLAGNETKQWLADELGDLGARLTVNTISELLQGHAKPTPQKRPASYDKRITKSDGHLDWTKPAARLVREIRAYLGWPGSTTEIAGREVIVTAAHVSADAAGTPGTMRVRDKQMLVGTASGTLVIDQLKPAGKREMAASEFIAGMPELRSS